MQGYLCFGEEMMKLQMFYTNILHVLILVSKIISIKNKCPIKLDICSVADVLSSMA